jgi:diguanylate cyclase (GGDEF)-like protein
MLHPLDCRFRDAETEARYRAAFVDADRGAATVTALVLLVPMLGFFVADLGFFARSALPMPLVLARLGMVALTVALIARLRWPIEPPRMDRLMLGWWLLAALFTLYVNSTRPHGYLLHNVIDAAVVMIACVMPLTVLPWQLAPGLLLAGGNVLGAVAARDVAGTLPLVVVLLSYVTVLGVGYACAWRLHAMRREHFAALQAQLGLQQQLEALASSDALSGLPNRRHFLERAALEFERARRHARELSVLMIDIDHFKRINDTWGHTAGDQALVEVARALRAELRGEDLPARMGGAEFAVLMPETPATRAAQVAERLRARCAELARHAGDTGARLTLSIGVATHGPADTELAALLRRADHALHEARHEGRDRVIAR